MQDFLTKYQHWLTDLAAAVSQAKQQQVAQLFNLTETIKAYWQAGQDLTALEASLFVETFRRQAKADDIPSYWPEALWYELAQVTDKTQLEWQELTSDFVHQGHYQAGEDIGMGLYCCDNCGASQGYFHPTVLAECVDCGGLHFHRQGLPV